MLWLPEPYDPRKPAPVIVDLHGLNSNAWQESLYGRIGSTASARGFIVATPESAPGRTGWKLPGMPQGDDDIAYVGRLLDDLEQTLCVNPRREYATGMSNGAGLSAALVCGLRGRLAGVAPVAGLNLARPCSTARPTTIVAFHGTGDRIVPYGGGEPFQGNRARIPTWMRPADGSFDLPSIGTTATAWARAFGCAAPASRTTGEITHRTYGKCRDGVRVELYTVRDGGHTWPGAFPIGDHTTQQINATQLILNAFS